MQALLDEKQTKVLEAVVTSYMRCCRPVGSVHLWRNSHLGFSPAGIRSVMAELETAGLLSKPHVSAGRVPTERAYRFYVDRFARPIGPRKPEREAIRKAVDGAQSADETLQDITRLLESFSHLISAAVAPMTEHDERTGFRREYAIHVAGIANAVSENIDPGAARLLLAALEDRETVIRALVARDSRTGVRVRIGSENVDKPMKYFALVSSSYWVGRAEGAIGLIGPLSIQYPRIIGLTEFASRELGGYFSQRGGRF